MKNPSADDPQRIGPYDIIGVLGEGGMGLVYLGRHGSTLCAVKVMTKKFAPDPTSRQRFRREIEAMQRVNRPFGAKIIKHGSDDTMLWYASEYIPGPTLEEAVRESRFAGEALALFAYSLYEEIKAIHAAGIVHRDLKPANIILGPNGVRVIDFGIAYRSDLPDLTMDGAAPGTPNYMSPEQALGKKVTPASDVFSYGGILVFAATGRPPFSGPTSAAVMLSIVSNLPNLTGVPANMQAIVQRCLTKDVSNRATLGDVARMLPKISVARAGTTNWMPPRVAASVQQAELAATRLEYLRPTRLDPGAHGALPGGRAIVTGGAPKRYFVSQKPGATPLPLLPDYKPGMLISRPKKRKLVWPYVLVGLLAAAIGSMWVPWGDSSKKPTTAAELQWVPVATFKPAGLTNTAKSLHITKIDYSVHDVALTVSLTGSEQDRKAKLLKSCAKITPPHGKKDDYLLFTPDESEVDAKTNKVYLDGILYLPGEVEFTSPCDTAYGKQPVVGQTVIKVGTNTIGVKGVAVAWDTNGPVMPVLAARVQGGHLKVMVPSYSNRQNTYPKMCLQRGSGSTSFPTKVDAIKGTGGWDYKLLTFASSAGTLYVDCTQSGNTYKYDGTGVKLP